MLRKLAIKHRTLEIECKQEEQLRKTDRKWIEQPSKGCKTTKKREKSSLNRWLENPYQTRDCASSGGSKGDGKP